MRHRSTDLRGLRRGGFLKIRQIGRVRRVAGSGELRDVRVEWAGRLNRAAGLGDAPSPLSVSPSLLRGFGALLA